MIFTDCPYCSEAQVFGWEAGMMGGWFPSKCYKCNNVMWAQATSFNGETLAHEDFKIMLNKKRPYRDDLGIEMAANEAKNLSIRVYD